LSQFDWHVSHNCIFSGTEEVHVAKWLLLNYGRWNQKNKWGTIAHLKNSCSGVQQGPGRLYLQQERRAAAGRRSLSLVRIQEAESAGGAAAAVAEDTVR
jgi:hypothetical protein